MDPLPDLATLSLADIATLVADRRLPPVEKWNPTHCGDSEMRIARDGTWFHQGSPIGREAMVRLFSTILRREPDGSHVLVTPVEKLDIAVEDAPFVAVEMKAEGEGRDARLAFRLNTGDLVTADADHVLRFAQAQDGPRPYLGVRGGMEALVARPVYYEIAERALAGDDGVPGVWSDGAFFPAGTRHVTLAERLADALTADVAPEQPYLTGDHHRFDPADPVTRAAVLVAITDRAEPGVILTQRTETLRKHAGQVAFPGGRVDPEDVDVIAAALREAEEEIALPPLQVRIAGIADRYRTGTGYDITPVVGVVPPDLPLRASEAEVASVFEVPLAFLLDPANHLDASATWQGRERRFIEINWGDRRIWGATAAMIVNLSRRLRWA